MGKFDFIIHGTVNGKNFGSEKRYFNHRCLAAMEERGMTDALTGLTNRVAYNLVNSSSEIIGDAEFREACNRCNVDPASFAQRDREQL